MSSGKSLLLLCILPFGMFFLSAISMMFVKILLAVCMLVGGGLSESGLCVFCKLCSVCFLVVGKDSSVLLYSVVMLIVVIMGKWSDDSAC